MMNVSIIIPCYNAIGKIESCIKSLLAIDFPKDKYEIIFVDDCSTDLTYSYLQELCINYDHWTVIRMLKNTGSPSIPRNTGVEHAKGKYIFFLDCDDEIISDTLSSFFNIAENQNADVVRGYLITDDGNKRCEANKVIADINSLSMKERIEIIISKQSTTPPAFILRDLILAKKVKWDSSLRMGEDTIFLIDILTHAQNLIYIDHPTYIYNKKINEEASSTQTYGSRELKNHLNVWKLAQEKLSVIGIDYYKIRLQVGLQTAIQSMIGFNSYDITQSDFNQFCNFINNEKNLIKGFNYSTRIKEVLEHIYNKDFERFLASIKPRLVIAGYDLKFILTLIPSLEKYYQVRVDEWTGHNSHDEKESIRCLNWADIVFCEWMLGNAVWYSNRIKEHQKLFIRMHRFELTTQWFKQIDFRKVNRVFAVSVYFFEKLIEYTKIPRSMACLLPNYVDSENYLHSANENKLFNLGIIGILPSRKGYLDALKLLNKLVKKDPRYKLFVYGKMPEELSWIKNNQEEMSYFEQCHNFIEDNRLQNNVEVKGWVDVKTELKDIGFILSTSEKAELFESFHIAPADGFAAGNQGLLLKWNGVEYIYPNKYIFNSIDDLANHITSQKNIINFNAFKEEGFSLVKNRYLLDNIILALHKNIKLSTCKYNYAPFALMERVVRCREHSKNNTIVTEVKNILLTKSGIKIKLPNEARSNCRINIEYTLNILQNAKINTAFVSLKTDMQRKEGFTLSDDKDIKLYKYLNTLSDGRKNLIVINLSKSESIDALEFKLWNVSSVINIEDLKISYLVTN